MNGKEIATKYAVENYGDYGVESVKSLIEWKGFKVFGPVFPTMVYIGPPVFILARNGKARKAGDDEWPLILQALPDDE